MSAFRFQSEKVHLTYKTHIDEPELRAMLDSKGTVKIYSFVHEVGDENEQSPTPYEHTRVFVWWTKRLNLTDPRTFDIGDIHPNITIQRSIEWARLICMKYHHGHKTKKDGKKYFIEPVYLKQEGVDDWKFDNDLLNRVVTAPSLQDACEDSGIMPRSVGDIVHLRNQSKSRKLNPPKYAMASFNRPPLDLTLPVLLYGESDCGKTQYAKAHFENPLIARHNEAVKQFDSSFHDGIVFDDMTFKKSSLEDIQHLLDMDEDSTMRCLHGSYTIPAGTKKIFCSNQSDIFHPAAWLGLNAAQKHSIERRYTSVQILTKCFDSQI